MLERKQPNERNNINNLLPFSDEQETNFNPTDEPLRISTSCKKILSILEIVNDAHPERQLQLNASIAGEFLAEIVEHIDTKKHLVQTIVYLTKERLPEKYVGDFLKEIVSKDLRSRYKREEVVAIQEDLRALNEFPEAIFIQLLSPKETEILPSSLPIHRPIFSTSKIISVPPTSGSDNHKDFIQRYQITFKNESLIPTGDCKWLQYCDESGVKFLHNHGSGYHNSRIGSGFMVILEAAHQSILGISSLTRQPITLDSLAVKSVCYQPLRFDQSIDREELIKLLYAIDRSFENFSVGLSTYPLSIDHIYLELALLIGKEMALCFGHKFSVTGDVMGVWPGRDCMTNLGIGKPQGKWLNLFEFGKEWKVITLQDRIAQLEGDQKFTTIL
ncbi:hypothetical protein BTUL_0321g00080 [Botrytis tulipae]|uniref:Uncharacterized protein n=1 Tax=Botrytis tulipae TaxID=87230 RepID=A0A4Z1E4T9_9HELO|nr:hypothetical protein BTUL_0321g00080 [Botrytis tulipae]